MRLLWLIMGITLLPLISFTQETKETAPPTSTSTLPVYSSDALNKLYMMGLQFLNEGDLTQAEISFRSIVAFPNNEEDWRVVRHYKGKALFYLGDIYFIQKRYDKSAESYKQVIREYRTVEEYSTALFKLGRSLILAKKEKEGIDVLKNYHFNYAADEAMVDNTLYWLANAYISLEDPASALKLLNQLIRDYPDSPMSYDARLVIRRLNTDYTAQTPLAKDNQLQTALKDSKIKVDRIEKEKDLIMRMKQLLTLKEELLITKEKKLELLKKVSKSRSEAIKNNALLANPNSLK
ncbi:MAG: tetratricopeptide repeat protein [Brevinema sp.]